MSLGWLKTVGIELAKGLSIVSGIEPLVAGFLPAGSPAAAAFNVVSKDLAEIGGIVTTVEGASAQMALATSTAAAAGTPLTSAQKIAMATPGVTQVILQSSLLAGKTIQDPTGFANGVSQVINGVVAILNSLHANVQTTSKT